MFSSAICEVFKNNLFDRTPQVAASVVKTDQKKQDIVRNDILRILLLKHNDVKT